MRIRTSPQRTLTYTWPAHLQDLHINVKEALALLLALHLWQPKDTHVTVWIDNTAVIGAVTKGYSPADQLNTVVKSILNPCEAATSSLVPYHSWQIWIGIVVYACYIRRFTSLAC